MGRQAWLGTLVAMVVLALPAASRPQGSTRHVNATDPACQGQAPCYSSIQAAVTAAQAGDRIVIQPGTYVEQVNVSGKNGGTGATEADRIVIEADPTAATGSVVLDGSVSQCTNGYAVRFQQSKLVTLRGLTITGAGGQAVALMGGNNGNQAIPPGAAANLPQRRQRVQRGHHSQPRQSGHADRQQPDLRQRA